jgi:hypothetical protein
MIVILEEGVIWAGWCKLWVGGQSVAMSPQARRVDLPRVSTWDPISFVTGFVALPVVHVEWMRCWVTACPVYTLHTLMSAAYFESCSTVVGSTHLARRRVILLEMSCSRAVCGSALLVALLRPLDKLTGKSRRSRYLPTCSNLFHEEVLFTMPKVYREQE